MSKTIGTKLPPGFRAGDYPCYCDYCGVPWYRSQMRIDRGGKLYCPDEGNGLDAVALTERDAADEAAAVERELATPAQLDGRFAKMAPQEVAPLLETIIGSGGRSQ